MAETMDHFDDIMASLAPEDWGIYIDDINTGWGITHNASKVFEAASLNKLALAYALDQKGMSGERSLFVPPMDVRIRGTGVLQYLPDNYQISVDEARYWLLAESDNVAAKLLLAELGDGNVAEGVEAVNEILERSDLSLEATRLISLGQGRFEYGKTNAREAALLMREAGINGYPALSASHVQYGMREGADATVATRKHDAILTTLKLAGRLHLPVSYDWALQNLKLASSEVELKEGSYDDDEAGGQNVRHQVALFGGGLAVVSALSSHSEGLGYKPSHPAHEIHRKLGEFMRLLSAQV